MVFETEIKGGHLVGQISDRNTWTEEVGRKDDASVFEANLRILELVAVWLLLPILVATREMGGEAGGQLLMMFKIAEAKAEFVGRPHQRRRESAEVVVKLRSAHSKRAQVVADHGDVVQSVGNLAPGPNAGSVRWTKEFVGDQASIHAQPEWKISFDAPCPRQGPYASAHAKVFVELIIKVPGKHNLRAQALRGIGSPGVQEVAEFRVQEPP